jgi:hypothetical protein
MVFTHQQEFERCHRLLQVLGSVTLSPRRSGIFQLRCSPKNDLEIY